LEGNKSKDLRFIDSKINLQSPMVTCVALHVGNFTDTNQTKVLSKWPVGIVLLARTQVCPVESQSRLELLSLGVSFPGIEA